MKLTDAKLRTLTTPGKHADGHGLYLEVSPTGGWYWRPVFADGVPPRRQRIAVVH